MEFRSTVHPRPRPVRRVVNNTAAVGGIAFVVFMIATGLVDLMPNAPISEGALDWVRFILGVVALVAGTVAGYRTENAVKQEVTPLEDPRSAAMEPLLTPAEWAQRYGQPTSSYGHESEPEPKMPQYRRRDRQRGL